MKEILQYIEHEWATVYAAPFTFLAILVLACGVAYAASKWKHGATIDLLRERISAKDQELDRYRKQSLASETRDGMLPKGPPEIEIRTMQTAPYHIVKTNNGHAQSTVAVGIRNAGERTLSNCKVYAERIAPPLSSHGSSVLLLDGTGFQLRHDDPEKLVEIAHRWEHHGQSRFSVPYQGGFFNTEMSMNDGIRRKFAIRVAAQECERSAIFEMWTDESMRLHLEFLNYSS